MDARGVSDDAPEGFQLRMSANGQGMIETRESRAGLIGARQMMKTKLRRFAMRVLPALVLLGIFMVMRADAYTLLAHEELIDLNWQYSIVPLLLSRYPDLTAAQLEEARAYAYGGCVIQDIGYYPFGDKMFSNLTHYVRTGDFVVNLFRDAQNADELAFAVGALSHYVGDSIGHAEATNISVPVEFPKLQAQYGNDVNYAEGRHQHVQTEFAFDIDEIAHHRMAPVHYLRHIGLKVPVKQLALAYYQTYGLNGEFSPRRQRINVREYRFMVHTFFPRVAYAITLLHRGHEPAEPDTADTAAIDREVAVVAARNDWGPYRRHAGVGTYMLAGFLFVLPKVGSLKLIDVKGPTTATESDYLHSVVVSTSTMHWILARFTPTAAAVAAGSAAGEPGSTSQVAAATPNAAALPAFMMANRNTLLRSDDPRHPLPNRDLDTGRVVQPGGYSLTDSTYAELLHQLTRQPAQAIPPGIKRDVLAFYADPNAPIATKKNAAQWAEVQADLAILAAMPTSTEPPLFLTYGDDAAGGAE